MKITKFRLNQEIANFINTFSVVLTTEEGNTYVQIPVIFKVEDMGQELSVIEKDKLPEDLIKVLNQGTENTAEEAMEKTYDVSEGMPEEYSPDHVEAVSED